VREEGTAYTPQRIVVSFGPEHAPLEQRQVVQAIEEAQTLVPKPKLIVFAAFQFDPEAAKDIDETNWTGVTLLKVQMNADLLTDDLKKKRASNASFWLIGQPDVRLERIAPRARTRANCASPCTDLITTTPRPATLNREARTKSPSLGWSECWLVRNGRNQTRWMLLSNIPGSYSGVREPGFRVIVNTSTAPPRVITAYFDRRRTQR
jgi:predicted transposase YbfD/YdcC